MKHYLAVFTGSPDTMAHWQQLSDTERREREARGVAAWRQWATDHAAAIVDMGGPLSRTKRVTPAGVADVRNTLAGYTVVRAESQDAAAHLFVGHPHFTIFPGDGVDVMEVMAIPGG